MAGWGREEGLAGFVGDQLGGVVGVGEFILEVEGGGDHAVVVAGIDGKREGGLGGDAGMDAGVGHRDARG